MAVETEESGMSGTVPAQCQESLGLSVIDSVPPQSPEGLRASVIDSVLPQSPEALRASIIDSVPPKFPEGLRVLVVDDDQTCLRIVARMLERYMYEVVKCRTGEEALSLLREDSSKFDIVLSDVHMPDMNGFKLLEIIGLEMDMPVVMMSSDENREIIMKAIVHGACDYLLKPVRMDAIQLLWQHVIRKKRNELLEMEQAKEDDEENGNEEGGATGMKRRKDREDDEESRQMTTSAKKTRMVWTADLHRQFVAAVEQLGYSKAAPKKILGLMNVPGLTREHVASHLQKFRFFLRRVTDPSDSPPNTNTKSNINGFNPHHTLVGQVPLQRLTLGGISRNSTVQQPSNGSKPAKVHHEVPASTLQQPAQMYGNMDFHVDGSNQRFLNLPPISPAAVNRCGVHGTQSNFPVMQMPQNSYGMPMLTQISGHQQYGPRPLSSQILSNDIGSPLFRTVANSMEGNAATCYPQASPIVDLSKGQSPLFALETTPEMNAIYGHGSSSGQGMISRTEEYAYRHPENIFEEPYWMKLESQQNAAHSEPSSLCHFDQGILP